MIKGGINRVQHGDISNQRSYVIGFRCENSLLHYKENNLADYFLNAIKGKTKGAEVDENIYSILNYIYWNTEYTIVLVINDKNYTDEAKKFFSDFPFNQVANIKSISEVSMMLLTGELSVFVSDDTIDRQSVNSQYAVDSDTFNTMLRRRIKRFEES